jgi:hypothetical protein
MKSSPSAFKLQTRTKKENLDIQHLCEQNSQPWHIITSLTPNTEISETPKLVKWHISFKLLFLSKQMAHADTNLNSQKECLFHPTAIKKLVQLQKCAPQCNSLPPAGPTTSKM